MRAGGILGSQSVLGGVVRATLEITWGGARLTLLALMRILEPIVKFALGATALLLVLTGLFLEAVSSRPIPLAAMLACAVGCVGLLGLYQAIIRLLS